ncbi:MAG: T9SS type A sorting domain-containing protein [Candidatus Cloacimonetes bacterium]|nr:T9SS type A sorting domain-containing protein [Candidatus Cloacimonadota bacterium]MCF7813667.1 T9SS type A sorting domain-containing protein [Candidatus Cloacimonadota bacterium]MCF7867177.1 T9SS type A sorting domain-containing protein [Candidatus Cloacimonadota bacterium]MCF7882503.1 T9SS type A sorting domain-containing protein [Candidatus Cloacimonadota bacterium]
MKKVLLIFSIILTFSVLSAQLEWSNSLPVRQGVNIEWSRASEPMNDGSVVYVWSDTRYGDRDLWAQRVDSSGNLLWGSDGKLVNGEINRQEDPVVIGVGNGEVIIAWVDFRYSDAGDIFAQKLDTNGNLMWDSEAVELCSADDIQISLNIVEDTNGGAYIIWLDSRNPGGVDIYGTHVDTNGNIVAGWDADGNAIAVEDGDQNYHTFWEDGTGGAILAWQDTRIADDANIYVQRIDSGGSLLWNAGGNLLVGATGIQEKPKMSPDGTGSFIFSWRDKRSDNFGDIYAQRVNLDGNLLWTNDVEVYVGNGVQRNVRLTSSSDTGVIAVWEDGRNEVGAEFKDIFIQKIDVDGNLLWNSSGEVVVEALNDQINPRLTSDGNGGAWIVWEDGRTENHPFGDVFLQHFDSTGSTQLTTNGMVICDEAGYQFSPLVKISNSSVFVVWGDTRTGSTGIYVQILDFSGNIQLDEDGELIWYGLDGDALDFVILENQENPVVLWEDTRNASIATQIYMQVVNSNGTFGLQEDGVAITQMTGYDQDNFDAYKETDESTIALVWEENRGNERKVYAQAVDLNATSLWNDMGIQLSSIDYEQYSAKISLDNSSYYAGWTDYNGDFISPVIRVMGQKLDASGNLQWGTEGVEIADRPGDDVITDVVGRYYIWQNESWPDYNIYAKLVNEDGTTAAGWDDNGTLICDADENQKEAKGIMTPDGLLILWKDARNGDFDIYGQLITEDGVTQWEDNGKALVSVVNDQELSNFLYNDGVVMTWEDYRTGSAFDVYMQQFDTSGNEVFTADGLPIIVHGNDQVNPYITMSNDEYMIFWEDYQTESESNLMGQYIHDDGSLEWPSLGFMIDDGIKNQNKPEAVSHGMYSYVFWEDTRSSGKTDIYNIFAQKVEYEPVSVNNNEIPQEFNVMRQNFPNPFKTSTAISFNINTNQLQNAKVEIFNTRGQKIRSVEIDNSSIVWDGKDFAGKTVSNGVYFYKLKAKGFDSKPRKMILLK